MKRVPSRKVNISLILSLIRVMVLFISTEKTAPLYGLLI